MRDHGKRVKRGVLLFIGTMLMGLSLAEPTQHRPLRLFLKPGNGATDVSAGVTLKLRFSRSVKKLTVQMKESQGDIVKGELRFLPKTRKAEFDPFGATPPYAADVRLKTETKYIVEVEADDTHFTSTFTTGNLGLPFSGDLVGKTFRLGFTKAKIVEPAGLQSLVSGAGRSFNFPELRLSVQQKEDSSGEEALLMVLSYRLPKEIASEKGDAEESVELPTLGFQNPFFHLGPVDLVFSVMKSNVTLRSAFFGGVFTPDGEGLSEVEIAGVLDVREGLAAAGEAAGDLDPEQVRQMLKTILGKDLEACKDGKPYCLKLRMTGIEGRAVAEK